MSTGCVSDTEELGVSSDVVRYLVPLFGLAPLGSHQQFL